MMWLFKREVRETKGEEESKAGSAAEGVKVVSKEKAAEAEMSGLELRLSALSLKFSESDHRLSLLSLPPEAILHIASFTDPGDVLFLGLTCRRIWATVRFVPGVLETSWTACLRSESRFLWAQEVGALEGVGSKTIARHAAIGGDPRVFTHVRKLGYPWDKAACLPVALAGRLFVLRQVEIDVYLTMKGGALGGHVDVIQWLVEEKHVEPRPRHLAWAAQGGHLPAIACLLEYGCPMDSDATTRAAEAGHLHVLQYLHDAHCPWHLKASRVAASQGHLQVLQFMRANHCPIDQPTVLHEAQQKGHPDIVEWVQSLNVAVAPAMAAVA
mmetsp:Transcript_5677/g.16098  ORF Transcript_5677/g.16098 Transcript_5677/m.16098 type:complete len:327 (+) Transcript_5677:159-1139(+)